MHRSSKVGNGAGCGKNQEATGRCLRPGRCEENKNVPHTLSGARTRSRQRLPGYSDSRASAREEGDVLFVDEAVAFISRCIDKTFAPPLAYAIVRILIEEHMPTGRITAKKSRLCSGTCRERSCPIRTKP